MDPVISTEVDDVLRFEHLSLQPFSRRQGHVLCLVVSLSASSLCNACLLFVTKNVLWPWTSWGVELHRGASHVAELSRRSKVGIVASQVTMYASPSLIHRILSARPKECRCNEDEGTANQDAEKSESPHAPG